MNKNSWKEVPAWEAMKALQQGTHDIQRYFSGDGKFKPVRRSTTLNVDDRCRIRCREMNVNITIPKFIAVHKHVDSIGIVIEYNTQEDRDTAFWAIVQYDTTKEE